MSRIFIALTPPVNLNKEIVDLKNKMKKFLVKKQEVNWLVDSHHHLTLNYIGFMEPEQKEELFKGLEEISILGNNMNIEIREVSYFPHENGQVVVANVFLNPQLQKLHEQIENIVGNIGFNTSLKQYRPHITLGRFKNRERPFIGLIQMEKPISEAVNTIDVYENKTESRKTKYTLIKQFDL